MAKKLNMPPTPIGRFIAAMRAYACTRTVTAQTPEYIRTIVSKLPIRGVHKVLRRQDVVNISKIIYDIERTLPRFIDVKNKRTTDESVDYFPIIESDIANIEQGRSNLSREKIYWILRGVLLSHDDAEFIIANESAIYGIESGSGLNCHIYRISNDNRGDLIQLLLLGEYGPQVGQAFRFQSTNGDWYQTVWLTSEVGTKGRFEPNELYMKVTNEKVKLPNEMEKMAQLLNKEWSEQRMNGFLAPTNNSTICLEKLTSNMTDDEDERVALIGVFSRSQYVNNVIAKGSKGAVFRWEELQRLEYPPSPVGYLASGVGVAICVYCDNGRRVILGQRSLRETFRKGEFDIAVVEGIRPTANVTPDGLLDLYGVVYRALDEELGTDSCEYEFGKSFKEFISDISIFEIGVDLKYYQWNFLSYVVLDLTFEQVHQLWTKAKDRKENQRLISIPAEKLSITEFASQNHMWSCGCTCLLRSFELMQREKTIR